AAQAPEYDEADRDGQQADGQRAAEPRQRKGELEAEDVLLEPAVRRIGRHREDRRRVSAGGLEDDEAEVHQARHAELQIEGEAGHDVNARGDQEGGDVVDLVAAHQPAGPSAPIFERSPCGRRTMTSTRSAKATTSLYWGESAAALNSVISPISTAPSMAPYGCPAPPKTAAARITTRYPAPFATPKDPESIAATAPAPPHSP